VIHYYYSQEGADVYTGIDFLEDFIAFEVRVIFPNRVVASLLSLPSHTIGINGLSKLAITRTLFTIRTQHYL
jgi:hypothetical protein